MEVVVDPDWLTEDRRRDPLFGLETYPPRSGSF
jgi:hypothetical protein